MDENKKSKATGISIGLIVVVVFLAFGFLIGLTQTKGAKNLGNTSDYGPYADLCLSEEGELIYYTGTDTEVIIPETYSLGSVTQTKTITDTNINDLTNVANRLGIKNFSISAEQVTEQNALGGIDTFTNYTLSFKAYTAVVGTDITTTRIGQYAFQDNETIEKITLPETLTYIEPYAFSNCVKLSEINLPNSITEIGDFAFQNCDGLKEITLPQNLRFIRNGLFQDCNNLEKVDMQDGIINIWSQAFYNCRNLTEIKFSTNLHQIETNAFFNCIALKEIELPASLTYMAHRSFYNCRALEKVVMNATNPPNGDSMMFTNTTNLKIYVPDDSYDTYINSYPWNNYSTKIFKVSELSTETVA